MKQNIFKLKKLFILTLFALTASSIFAFEAGDTILITTGSRYLAVNNKGDGFERPENVNSTRCFWVVGATDNASGYTFQSLSNPTKYLRLSYTAQSGKTPASASLSLGNIQTLYVTSTSKSKICQDKTFPNSGGYLRYNSGWTAATKKSDGTEVTFISVTYLNNVATLSGPINVTTENILEYNKSSVQVKFQYQLNIKNGYYNKSTGTAVYNATQNNETSANVLSKTPYSIIPTVSLQYGDKLMSVATTVDATGDFYVATINAVGNSPMKPTYTADLKDNLNISATYSGKTAEGKAEVVRKVYQTKDVDELTIEATPTDYTFTQNSNAEQAFAFSIKHRKGTGLIYDLDGNYVAGTGNATTTELNNDSQLDPNAFKIQLIDNETSGTATWAAAGYPKRESWSNVKLAVVANDNEYPRSGRLALEYDGKIAGCESNHYAYTIINISQDSKYASAASVLIHKYGYANTNWDKNGYQAVHEVENTYYVEAGDVVTLACKQPNGWGGWSRWYNYDNGHSIGFNDGMTWWRNNAANAKPTANHNDISTGGDSQGQYRAGDPGTPIVKIVNGLNGGTARIACDISKYTDYGDDNTITKSISNKTYVYEPTLSYRQIFNLVDANVMINALASCKGTKFYEEYNVIAPIGQTITLTPAYGYANLENAKRYIYEAGKRVGTTGNEAASWYWQIWKNGALIGNATKITTSSGNSATNNQINTTTDYLAIKPTQKPDGTTLIDGDTVVYMLKTANYNLCLFRVAFKDIDNVGPKAAAADGKAIITYEEMCDKTKYDILGSLTFDFDTPGNTRTFYGKPLPWEQSACGFVYLQNTLSYNTRTNRPDVYYGEYSFVNTLNGGQSWMQQGFKNHANGNNTPSTGYLMCVDGTQAPGLVASLAVDAELCAGQKMYCSAWIGNANNQTTNDKFASWPKFKFVIEGKFNEINAKKPDMNWHDVSTFYTGDFPMSGDWKQINFSIDLTQDYDQYRVSIYNFATSVDGNDFVLDDIYIYATRPPLMVYQASTSCVSAEQTDDPIQVVMRLDYQNLPQGSLSGTQMFYEIVEGTTNLPLLPYFLGTTGLNYGFVNVPANDYNATTNPDGFDPTVPDHNIDPTTGKAANHYSSLAEFVSINQAAYADYVAGNKTADQVPVIGYVKDGINEFTGEARWVMYIIQQAKMQAEHMYDLHMAYSYDDIKNPLCALNKSFLVTGQVFVEVDGEAQSTSGGLLCANGMYDVNVVITNKVANTETGELETISGTCYSDWLIGNVDTYSIGEDTIAEGETQYAWEKYCGYKYLTILDAIESVRNDEANIGATTLATLAPNTGRTYADYGNKYGYDIVKDLVDRGFLELYVKSREVTMPTGTPPIAYTLFPIPGTGERFDNGESMSFCSAAMPITLRVSDQSDVDLQIGTTPRANLPEAIRYQPTKVRTSVNNIEEVVVKIQNIQKVALQDYVYMISSTDPDAKNAWYAYEPDIKFQVQQDGFVYYKNGDEITFSKATSLTGHTFYQMKEGYEYTFEIKLQSVLGKDLLDDGCPVGSVYFTLVIVPEYEMWKPGNNASANWSEDDNWVMIDPTTWAEVTDGRKGYVPMGHTNVIIGTSTIESYPTVVPTATEVAKDMDNRYYETYDVNYIADHCNNILFQGNAKIQDQHLLNYQKAYVDMTFNQGEWNIISAPLKSMYSGDMYEVADDNIPFAPAQLEERSNSTGYAFWMSRYNASEVYHYEQNKDVVIEHPDAGWSKLSNDVATPFEVGSGMAILGYNLDNPYEAEVLKVSLPKQEDTYGYFLPEGGSSTRSEATLTNREDKNTFALNFDKKDAQNKVYTEITLTNGVSSEYFIFGNPSMAYIDMTKFFENATNAANFNTTYYYLENNSLTPGNGKIAEITSTLNCIPPMRGVVLVAKTAGTSAKVVLTPDMLKSKLGENETRTDVPIEPTKVAARVKDIQSQLIVSARIEDTKSQVVITKDASAKNEYVENEDVVLLTAGNENFSSSTLYTPLSIFTVEDNKALSVDARNDVSLVPLAFNSMYGNDVIEIHFTIATPFTDTLYLYDALTETRYRIIDNLYLDLEMPANGEVRYYIQGSKAKAPGTVTNVDNVTIQKDEKEVVVSFLTHQAGKVTMVANEKMQSIEAYDIAGRLISVKENVNNATFTLDMPQGAALIKVTTINGSTTGKVLVK